MLVYQVTNTANGKVYVGQTSQGLDKRWRQHVRGKRGAKSRLFLAIQKYGQKAFTLSVLEHCSSRVQLNKSEAKWIGILDATNPSKGYNLLSDAYAHPSDIVAKRIRCIETGKIYPSVMEAARELGCWDFSVHRQLRGRIDKVKGFSFEYVDPVLKPLNLQADETRRLRQAKTRAGRIARITAINTSMAGKTRYTDPRIARASAGRSAGIYITPAGRFINSYDAAAANGCSQTAILHRCRGKTKSAMNWSFEPHSEVK